MKKVSLSHLALITLSMGLCLSIKAQTKLLFDKGWQFTRNGNTIAVDLPHDWDIYDSPDPATGATGTGGGWFQGGKAEYRKKFRVENAELKDDSRAKLHFEGVYQRAEVFINGQKAGQHSYGYTPFTIDITPYLYKDNRENEVVVKVDNSGQPNCRWYSGSGIYRHVWLLTMPALHIAENGVFIITPEVTKDKATIQVEVTVQNEAATALRDFVEVEGQKKEVVLDAGESKSILFTYTIERPQLWSPNSPYLYTANAKLSNHNSRLLQKRDLF